MIRKFEMAVKELRKPAETLPEASCALGIAQYLGGRLSARAEAFTKCPDPGVFAYLAEARTGSTAMPGRTSHAIRRRTRRRRSGCPAPRTKPGPATRVPMTAMYLDAAEKLLKKDNAGAKDLLKQIVEKDRHSWMDPVYIAAEADYAKLLKAEGKKANKAKRNDYEPLPSAFTSARR